MSRALSSGSVSQSMGVLGTKRWLQVYRKFLKSSQPPGSQQETGSHILVTRVEGSPSFSPSAVAAGLGASVSPRHGHALSASQVRSVNFAGSSPTAQLRRSRTPSTWPGAQRGSHVLGPRCRWKERRPPPAPRLRASPVPNPAWSTALSKSAVVPWEGEVFEPG